MKCPDCLNGTSKVHCEYICDACTKTLKARETMRSKAQLYIKEEVEQSILDFMETHKDGGLAAEDIQYILANELLEYLS